MSSETVKYQKMFYRFGVPNSLQMWFWFKCECYPALILTTFYAKICNTLSFCGFQPNFSKIIRLLGRAVFLSKDQEQKSWNLISLHYSLCCTSHTLLTHRHQHGLALDIHVFPGKSTGTHRHRLGRQISVLFLNNRLRPWLEKPLFLFQRQSQFVSALGFRIPAHSWSVITCCSSIVMSNSRDEVSFLRFLRHTLGYYHKYSTLTLVPQCVRI